MGRSERTFTIGEACIALGLAPDGKTLRRWMQKAGIEGSKSERDSRFRELTLAQMKVLASAHNRTLASDGEVIQNTSHTPSVKSLQLQVDRMRADIEALQAQVLSLIQEKLQPAAASANFASERYHTGSRTPWMQGEPSSVAFDDLDGSASMVTNVVKRPLLRTTRRASSSGSRSSLPPFPDYLVQISDVAEMHEIPERTLRGAAEDGRLSAIAGPWRARSSRGGYEVRLALDDEGLRQVHALYGNRPDFTYDPTRCSYCQALQAHYGVLPPPAQATLIPSRQTYEHGFAQPQEQVADALQLTAIATSSLEPESIDGPMLGPRAPVTIPLVPALSRDTADPSHSAPDGDDAASEPAYAAIHRRHDDAYRE